MPGPLSGVRLFDLTIVGVGPFATGILGKMGAEVVAVEQGPSWPPVYQGSPPNVRGLSTLYMTVHLNKRSLYLNLKDPEGLETAYRLIGEADIFAENMTWGTVQRLGLGSDRLLELNPRLVYGNFPGWGREGPYVQRRSADAITQVFSGSVAINGRRGGEPEILRWPALWDFNASLHIAVSLLLGLLARERTGSGLSLLSHQIGASVNIQLSRVAEFLATGDTPARMGSGTATTVPNRAYRCRDGRWLAVGVVRDDQWRRLWRAIGAEDLGENDELSTNRGRVRNRALVDGALGRIFATQAAKWWEIQLRKAKVPASLFLDYTQVLDDPQVRANGHFVWLRYPRDDETAEVLAYPDIGQFPPLPPLPFGSLPFQYSKTPIATTAGTLPGANTDHILRHGWLSEDGGTPATYHGPRQPMATGVLDGVTVLDMTQGVSGPFASLMLAECGARVIKVEPPEGDYTRGWEPRLGDVGAAFFHLNRNKEGLRIDLERPADRDELRELLRDVDVFIEEEGQDRLGRWGLDQASLEQTNPAIITCSISPFGEDGPLRDQPGSELVFQAMSDFLSHLGEPGEEPVRMGPDMATAGTSLYACQAILGALYHQWRTGVGQRIAISELGALLHQRAVQWTSLVDPDEWNGYLFGYLKPPDHPYKTKDQPIMVNPISRAEDMPLLMEELGMESHLGNPLFQHPPEYLVGWGSNGAVDTGEIPMLAKPIWEEAFSRLTAEQIADVFIKYGGNGVLANDYRQLYDHPQVRTLGLFGEMDDPTLGTVRYQRMPWTLDGVPVPPARPFRDVTATRAR